MRTRGIIIGVTMLAVTFSVVWILLQPEPAPAVTTNADTEHPADRDAPAKSESNDTARARSDHRRADQVGDTEPSPPDGKPVDESSQAETSTVSTNPSRSGRRAESPVEEGSPDEEAEERAAANFITGHSRPRGQTRGATRPRARRIRNPAGVKDRSEADSRLAQDRRGLYARYWRLDDDEISGRQASPGGAPDLIRIDRQVWFPDEKAFTRLPISTRNFAAVWEGFLVIDEPGDYWFFLGADNGGRVEIDGETVLLQDRMVRYVEVSTVLTLEEGLHPIRIEFAQFDNGVMDWRKCAASFMHVPEGESKPVPVPPEMLMLPEWMWSNEAPVITSLSAHEGEIGDEITINGQNLYEAFDRGDGLNDIYYPKVTFAGEPAEVLEKSPTRLRVRVPIGAQTGEVIVYRLRREGDGNGSRILTTTRLRPGPNDIPSNSADFHVTTQFGLMAEWHDLSGWSNFGLEALEGREPDFVRLEKNPGRETGPAGFAPFGAVWKGRIGLPSAAIFARRVGARTQDVESELSVFPRLQCSVTLNGEAKLLEVPEYEASSIEYACRFDLNPTDEYVNIEIAVVSQGQASTMTRALWVFLDMRAEGKRRYGTPVGERLSALLGTQYFFPPVSPPSPPEIRDVEPVLESPPPILPYDADDSRPSVAEGQEFTFTLIEHDAGEFGEGYPEVTVDDTDIEYTVTDERRPSTDTRELTCRALMPKGVGEGRMVGSVEDVESEPVFIDIRNKGLIAYLYDVPESGGLNSLPGLAPLTCFKVRKDRAINFETANDFDLPFPAETFVIEWLGGLIIEEEGDYKFVCRSDDGMKLWLDGNVVIDADHRQAPTENSGVVHLVPGTYRFRMQYFENAQHEVCVLEWGATRGESEVVVPREVTPARAFTNDVHPPMPNKTSTGLRTDGSNPADE